MSNNTDTLSQPEAVMMIVNAIRPLLAGYPPEVQSAVLADLTSMWLAGHICPGNAEATKRTREALLEEYVELVRRLIDPNEKMLGIDRLVG